MPNKDTSKKEPYQQPTIQIAYLSCEQVAQSKEDIPDLTRGTCIKDIETEVAEDYLVIARVDSERVPVQMENDNGPDSLEKE